MTLPGLILLMCIHHALALTGNQELDAFSAKAILSWSTPTETFYASDSLDVLLQVAAPGDWLISDPMSLDGKTDFDVVNRQTRTYILSHTNLFITETHWRLRPFLDGTYTIPSITIRTEDPDGHEHLLQTEPVELIVASILSTNTLLQDIAGPVTSSGYSNAGPWAGFIVGSVLLLLVSIKSSAKPGQAAEALTAEQAFVTDMKSILRKSTSDTVSREDCLALLTGIDHAASILTNRSTLDSLAILRDRLEEAAFAPAGRSAISRTDIREILKEVFS
jgi:hypothetical protein